MAQSKRTCESAYKDGFMAAWAETDVGWLRKSDAERILRVRSWRRDYTEDIRKRPTDPRSLTGVFNRACQDYFKISKGLRGRLMSMPSYHMMTHEELEHQLATETPANKTSKKKIKRKTSSVESQPIQVLSEYERNRELRVKRNHMKLGELGIPLMVQQQHSVKSKGASNRSGKANTMELDPTLCRRSSRVAAKGDEEEYEEEDESDESDSDFDEEEDEALLKPKKAKKKPAAKKKKQVSVKQPKQPKKKAAKTAKPAKVKSKEDWIAEGFDAEAVEVAMEQKPQEGTKTEIWNTMMKRFKFWMAKTNDPSVPCNMGAFVGLGQWVFVQRRRKKGKRPPALSKAEEDQLNEAGFSWDATAAAKASNRKLADTKWDAKFEQLQKFRSANGGREPRSSEDRALYFWCKNQRMAYRGCDNWRGRLTDGQAQVRAAALLLP